LASFNIAGYIQFFCVLSPVSPKKRFNRQRKYEFALSPIFEKFRDFCLNEAYEAE